MVGTSPIVDPDVGDFLPLQLELFGDGVENVVDATPNRRRKSETRRCATLVIGHQFVVGDARVLVRSEITVSIN